MATEISIENERFLEESVKNGRFENRQQALDEAVRLLREETEEQVSHSLLPPPDVWAEHFTAWAQSHRPRNPNLDDGRETIYKGRGE
jgi:Arc/MetJ-type ribon-helix-helix transcriptional regulator